MEEDVVNAFTMDAAVMIIANPVDKPLDDVRMDNAIFGLSTIFPFCGSLFVSI